MHVIHNNHHIEINPSKLGKKINITDAKFHISIMRMEALIPKYKDKTIDVVCQYMTQLTEYYRLQMKSKGYHLQNRKCFKEVF